MPEPIWIDPDVVVAVHAAQLAEHGGQDGVRDAGLLDSALQRPRHRWAFSDPKPDTIALAASLAFGVCRNHPFLDGNKRTAWVLCRTFLRLNGADVSASQSEIVTAVLALAAGETPEDDYAAWLRERLAPIA